MTEDKWNDNDLSRYNECLNFYYSTVSPNLTDGEKDILFKRLFEYWAFNESISDDIDVNEFPEMKRYREGDTVTGLEVTTLSECLAKDLVKPAELYLFRAARKTLQSYQSQGFPPMTYKGFYKEIRNILTGKQFTRIDLIGD